MARRLAEDGHHVIATGWRGYDQRMPWGADPLVPELPGSVYDVDFEDPTATSTLMAQINRDHGSVSVLVLCHCESVDSDIRTTTIESFDKHMAVNARATWQLIKSFAEQLDGQGDVRGFSPSRVITPPRTSPTVRVRVPWIASFSLPPLS